MLIRKNASNLDQADDWLQPMLTRVAIFLQDLTAGGAERMMLNLAGGIIDQGVQVDVVLVRAEGALFPAIPTDVRLIHLDTRRTMRSIPALAKYLRRERPLALLSALTHFMWPLFLLTACRDARHGSS